MLRLLLASTACYLLSACTQPINPLTLQVQPVESVLSPTTLAAEATITPIVLPTSTGESVQLDGPNAVQPLATASVKPIQMIESTPVVPANPTAVSPPSNLITQPDTQVRVQPGSTYTLVLPLVSKSALTDVVTLTLPTVNRSFYLPSIFNSYQASKEPGVGSGSESTDAMHALFLPTVLMTTSATNRTSKENPANHLTFLPLAVKEPAKVIDYRFQIDQARLLPARKHKELHREELYREEQHRDLQRCDEAHQLSVHVYDTCTKCDQTHRLSKIRVKVVQVDHSGHESIEYKLTSERIELGMATFELQRHAKIQLVDETYNDAPLSEVYEVWTHAPEIATAQLITAGYCSDESNCWTFASENRCEGQFSWEVVFKKK